MRKVLLISLLSILPLILSAGEFITKTSSLSVDKTIEKMKSLIETKKGMKVFAVIDHKADAKKADYEMNDEKVIVFGNSEMSVRMMLRDERVGLDLPLRVLVYQDEKEKTKIVYRDPKEWAKSFNLKGCVLLEKMEKVLDDITSKSSK